MVIISSLIQIPSILAWLPLSKKIGIITYNAKELVSLHFERLGISKEHAARCHVAGAPDGGSLRLLVQGKGPYSFADIEQEMIGAAKELLSKHDNIGAFVLECTQMPPFGESVQRATGLPTYDVYTMGTWFYSGLVRRRPNGWGDLKSQSTGPLVEKNIL